MTDLHIYSKKQNVIFDYKFYGLYDLSGSLFYVGITKVSLKSRLCGHIHDAHLYYSKMPSKKARKIIELNFNIKIKLIKTLSCTKTDALIHEMYLIQNYIKKGVQLTNGVVWIKKVEDYLSVIFDEVTKEEKVTIVKNIKQNKPGVIYSSDFNIHIDTCIVFMCYKWDYDKMLSQIRKRLKIEYSYNKYIISYARNRIRVFRSS